MRLYGCRITVPVTEGSQMNVDLQGFPTAPEGVFTRRSFLRLAGGTAAALGGASMLGAFPAAGLADAATASASKVGGQLTIFTWQGYDLTKPLAKWRSQHHIHQTVKFLNNQFDVASDRKSTRL